MCGVIGVMNQNRNAAPDVYIGLWAMQHRGKESARIVTSHGGSLFEEGGMGEVPQAFWSRDLSRMPGSIGIGHVRYSTAGESSAENIQPLKGVFRGFDFYVAHNGNLVNTDELRKITGSKDGCSDTRIIADLISISKRETFEEAILSVAEKLQGAFNLILLFGDKIYAIKDSFGFHPLQLGRRNEDFMIASESCVFNHLNAKLFRDIKPGNMLIIDKAGVKSHQWTNKTCFKIDIFEFIYFTRPDSVIHGIEAGRARYFMGRYLADRHPLDADIVVPVSDSGNEAALGYYERMLEKGHKIGFRPWALFRPHTVSRTFIEPVQEKRRQYLYLKFNPRPDQVKDKRIIVIDDSIVRGTTQKVVLKILKDAGARELNVLISSPPYLSPDFYGIDTYRQKEELIARRLGGKIYSIAEEIGSGIGGINYLGYLKLRSVIDAILDAAGPKSELCELNFYSGPFTGEYPAGSGNLEI